MADHTLYPDIGAFLAAKDRHLAKGPVALILAEDNVEIGSTLRHHIDAGFRQVVLFAPPDMPLSLGDIPASVVVRHSTLHDGAMAEIVNAVIKAAPEGIWIYCGYNAEYLFYPFCENRTVGEMIAFNMEERRDTILSYVIDLYAADIDRWPNAVSIEDAHLDRTGYYALARNDRANHNYPKERQLDFFGGLRWRFEEHVQPRRRRIDRVSLFKVRKGLEFYDDFTFNDQEYNTYSCPWHHNLTAAVCSFRTAKALRTNPGSRYDIQSFKWHNSARFKWHSQQLLDLGLMEPGQWF